MGVEVLSRAPERTVAIDHEAQRLAHFSEMLAASEPAKVLEAPLYMDTAEPIVERSRYFMQAERQMGTHTYLHPDYAEFADAGRPSFVPRRSRGAKRSAHGVFFGDLVFEDGRSISVAVKPHEDDSANSCATDYFANVAAETIELKTLDSVGMIVGPDDVAYSLTKLEPMLTTLDGVNWKRLAERNHGQFLTVWSQVARQMAMLHTLGSVSHGDLAARNIAMRPDDSSIFFIDWERARISTMPPRDPEGRYTHSRQDVGELMESLVRPRADKFKGGIGLLSDHPQPWEAFRSLVFDEYVATRLDSATPKELRDVKDELIELESSLKQHLLLILRDQQ